MTTLDPYSELDAAVMNSPELIGRECQGCMKILHHKHFRRDSSSKDGVYFLCNSCEAAPKLSIAEHEHRLFELNYNRFENRSQRFEMQDEYQKEKARWGKALHHSEFLLKLHKAVPNLIVRPGRIEGDLALFQLGGVPREDWGGLSYRYLFFIPEGLIPEFSIHEFNEYNVPVREKHRGWRTVLLRLILGGLLTEQRCDEVFGPAEGEASIIWRYKLYLHRNRPEKDVQ